MTAVGIPVLHAFKPDENIVYRKLTREEAYLLIQKSSYPDEDYRNELFDHNKFFDILAEDHPTSLIANDLIYDQLQKYENTYTDMLRSWNDAVNPVHSIINTIINVIFLECN